MIQKRYHHYPRAIFFVLLFATLCLSVLIGSVRADDNPANCPHGQGYWKNTANWPLTELTIGSQSYNQAELLILFNTPVGGDASLNLAHQLIAATLNVASGGDPVVASGVIAQANTLLAAYTGKLPYNVDSSSADGQTMVNMGGVLDSYNGGQLTVNCAPDVEETPEATPEVTATPTPDSTAEVTPESTPNAGGLPITIVIEGPVQAINVNIITIYNINIELDPNDQNLQIIQVGDIVHIDGDTQELNGTIIIVVINIIIINVDVNPGSGEIWRDDGNCSNPPPSWAPAHGWHRRCGDINVDVNINVGGSGGDKGMGMGMGDD
ncbi:MAG: hypothetical protein ABI690_11095 [Chloroflexota bacterium]